MYNHTLSYCIIPQKKQFLFNPENPKKFFDVYILLKVLINKTHS